MKTINMAGQEILVIGGQGSVFILRVRTQKYGFKLERLSIQLFAYT